MVAKCRRFFCMFLSLEPFALRQFNRSKPNQPGFIDYDPTEFAAKVNEAYKEQLASRSDGSILKPGYAPFCKHFFIENFTPAKTYAIAITPENRHLLVSDYISRTEHELPVLSRWFPSQVVETPVAKYLDIILYSREQIKKENKATGEPDVFPDSIEWGIISVKAQTLNAEVPMAPITMMRNALPLEEGGSGVPLDRVKYTESVRIWKEFAIVV